MLPLASKRHLMVVLFAVIVWAIAARTLVGQQSAEVLVAFGRPRIYLIGIVTEWLLLMLVITGLPGWCRMREVLGSGPWTLRRWGRYVLSAIAAAAVWSAFGVFLGKAQLLRPSPDDIRPLLALMPRDGVDRVSWVVLAFSAAWCEEFVYRGYLLNQLRFVTNHITIAVILQAVFYGLAHAALPWQIMIIITFLGILFGSLAILTKSIVPGILLHAAMDLLPLLMPRR